MNMLTAIHRYPVKSLQGETLSSVVLGENGIPGDRAWATRDEVRGGIRGGKKIPALMELRARYREEPPADGAAPAAEITAPGGEPFLTSDPDASQLLTKAIGHEVTLWPLVPADQLEHYKRGAPDDPDFTAELRATFARTPEEPLPDISAFPPEILQYESPPGTYFDAFPLLLLSTGSLATMQKAAGSSIFDVARFRPNLLVDCEDAEGFPEEAWVGGRIRIGGAVLDIPMACPRCVMTTAGFGELPKDPSVMRALVRENGGNLGVYARVAESGTISVGDRIELA